MHAPVTEPVIIRHTYSFEGMIRRGFANEIDDATQDTGPIDCDDPTRRQLEYDSFYGTSPLSSPSPSPPSSRPGSPSPSPTWSRPATPSLPHASGSLQAPDAPVSLKRSKQRRNGRRSKRQRRVARREERDGNVEAVHTPAPSTAQRHIRGAKELRADYNAADIPSASSGYIAKRDGGGRLCTLAELLAGGFELVKWDGRTARPITDSNGLVVAVLVGQPSDPAWQSVHEDAYSLLEQGIDRCRFKNKCTDHRRGKFAALNAGISFGGGQKMPGNLCHSGGRADVLQGLLDSPSFSRLAGFASGAFRAWMPKLYGHYSECLNALLSEHTNLRRNYESSVWGAAAFNFGPRTVTSKHRDFANLPYGVCSIVALGRYNHVEGGHIVLWDFGLVVEFPPGSTVIIPSAAVAHSNAPVAADERRGSFTQYSAGGLFRWVDQGFQNSSPFVSSLSATQVAELDSANKERCVLGLSLFSKLADLCPS